MDECMPGDRPNLEPDADRDYQPVKEWLDGREDADLVSCNRDLDAEWCNGNTADFGSVVPGSNPGSAATLNSATAAMPSSNGSGQPRPHSEQHIRDLEARVQALEATVTEKTAALADTLTLIDAWTSTVSHDLRGPLTLITVYADNLLLQLPDSDECDRVVVQVQAISRASRRLDKMLGQVVDSARLDVGRLRLKLSPCDVGPLVKDEVRRARRVHRHRGLRTDVSSSLPWVIADPRRVSQIVATLLSNALTYSPDDEVVRITARQRRDYVHIAVADKGPGFSPKEQSCVFNKNFQKECRREARSEGLGLSLTIAKRVALELGGDLCVASPGPGRGSTFCLRLPVAPESLGDSDDAGDDLGRVSSSEG